MRGYHNLRATTGALCVVLASCAALFADVGSASQGGGGAAPTGVVSSGPAASPSGSAALRSPALPASVVINRPTAMSLAQYRAIKAAAAGTSARRGAHTVSHPFTVVSPSGFNAIAQPQAQSTWPSDSNGAVGGAQIAETVNSHLTTYSKTGAQTTDRSFATVTGYTTTGLFDPRIIYDANFKRYIAIVDSSPQSSTLQNVFVMFSKSMSAGGAWWVYNLNLSGNCGGANPFFDYPQIGQTQDGAVITGNCFNGASYNGSITFGIAKAIGYNGLGFSTPVFKVSDGTLTPANVYDQNPKMELLSANVHEVAFLNPQSGFYGSVPSDTAISGFFSPSVPRSAGQAGCTTTSCHLDTSDGRFVQDSTQFGDQLWNVTTYGFSGAGSFATPSWGQFSIAGASTTQRGQVFADGCSDDFNASLVVSTADKMWLNWTSTDPQGSTCGQTFARQMEAGRLSTTASGTVTNVINPFTSPAELTGNFDPNFGLQRWGDTSSMSLDGPNAAWSVNNSVSNSSNWGTRWQKVTQ